MGSNERTLEARLARSCFLRVRHDREGNCHSELEFGLVLAWFPLHITHKPSWLGIHLGLHEG